MALELFAKQGYDATTIDEIAAAADLSARSFFRYFRTKEDLVMWDEYDASFLEAFEARLPHEPIIDSLRTAAIGWARDFVQSDRERVLLRIHLFLSVPQLQGRYWDGQQAMAAEVAKHIAQPRKLPPNSLEVRVIALAFIAALEAATEAWVRSDGRTDLAALVTDAIVVLQRGFA